MQNKKKRSVVFFSFFFFRAACVEGRARVPDSDATQGPEVWK